MAIARLDIPEGAPFPTGSTDPTRLHTGLAQLLVTKFADLKLLQPGEYDVTPEIWTKNAHEHEVVVFDDGTGIYRMFPKGESVGYLQGSQAGIRSFKGGQQRPLDPDNPLVVIGGGHPSKTDLQIFGLIAYADL